MKLTTKRRNEIYKQALADSYTDGEPFYCGLCYRFIHIIDENKKRYSMTSEEVIPLFPEFKLFQPDDDGGYWFGNIDKGEGIEFRRTVLELCIEMTNS